MFYYKFKFKNLNTRLCKITNKTLSDIIKFGSHMAEIVLFQSLQHKNKKGRAEKKMQPQWDRHSSTQTQEKCTSL